MIFSKVAIYACAGDVIRNAPFSSWYPAYRDKIVVGEYTDPCGHTVVRAWRNASPFGIDRRPDFGERQVGALDYTVGADALKIEFLHVYDRVNAGAVLPDPELAVGAAEGIALMVALAEQAARERCIDRLVMDTHRSLARYKLYHAAAGFRLNGRVASDHPAWLETEKFLVPVVSPEAECEDACAL